MAEQQDDYKAIIRDAVMNEDTFLRLTMSGKRRGAAAPYLKIVVRPVIRKDRRHLQFSYFDKKKDVSKNYEGDAILRHLDEALDMPFRQYRLQSATQDIHVQVTGKGAVHIGRGRPSLAVSPDLEHNRRKDYPLPGEQQDAFLRKIGIMNQAGRIKSTMQAKFRQINEFLRRLQPLIREETYRDGVVEIVDCGCGNAYLTFATYHYLRHIRGLKPHVVGIDRNPELIEKCRMLRDDLGWPDLDFYVAAIADFVTDAAPDMVLSLHACDTATDEAIARGIHWNSRSIVVAPCCQHELRPQIKSPSMQPILRHGLLKQRTAEIVTDAVRALVLRIMGYRTGVVEFVYPAHTPKNLMIRAEKTLEPGDPRSVREYLDMKAFWQVEPRIERLVGESLRRHLEAHEKA